MWLDIARRFGVHGYNSMSCEQSQCLRCCTSHFTDALTCAGLKSVHMNPVADPRESWPSARRPWTCNARVRRLSHPNASDKLINVPAAHVMLGLSSQIPRAVKALDREAFLSSSTKLAHLARDLLGMGASAATKEAITARQGCISNSSAWLHGPKHDAELARILRKNSTVVTLGDGPVALTRASTEHFHERLHLAKPLTPAA